MNNKVTRLGVLSGTWAIWALACLNLTGCSLAPGMYKPQLGPAVITLPVSEGRGEVAGQVDIQPINAELIIQLDKQKAAKPKVKELPLTYYQYRVGAPVHNHGPGGDSSAYRVGIRDVLTITVWEHPELTIPAGEYRSAEAAGTVVNEDGTIFYPYVGVVRVDGLTVWEIRGLLAEKLGKLISNVQLDVRVADYRSQRAYVTGEVKQPGIQKISDIPLTVVEAVNRSGGLTPESDPENATLTRDGETYRIDLLALFERGDATQNIPLKHGDVLQIPDRNLNKVFVLGEVRKPDAMVMNKGRMSLAEAIAAAGVDQTTANPARIFVMRPGVGKPALFHLDSQTADAVILADRFALEPRDIIYVDTADVVRWNRVISQLLPTAQMLWYSATTGL